MNSTTDRGGDDGDNKTIPGAGLKTETRHNLTVVYVDHELYSPNTESTESTDDEVGENIDPPNLTMVYIDHHLDGSPLSDASQSSDASNLLAVGVAVIQNRQGLFRLPPELRIMIWELLLPGKRILRARAWYGRDRPSHLDDFSTKIKGHSGRWYFRVYDWDFYDTDGSWLTLKIPIVLEICKESRSVALRYGTFIFSRHDKNYETGTWWNPNLDVLGFDHSWDLKQHPWALQHLQGLGHVKNVAIDEQQAWSFCYKAGYNGRHPRHIPRKLREPLAVAFEFRESDDTIHYILEFFPHFQQLGIYFPTIYKGKFWEWYRFQMGLENPSEHIFSIEEFPPEDDAFSVTFRLGSDIEAAVKELRNYRKLCMKTKVNGSEGSPPWDTLADGPVYSVKNEDLDIDGLDHWMEANFEMCQIDDDVPI